MTGDTTRLGRLAGSSGSGFRTTHWSQVASAGQGGSPEARAALEELCRAYWQPLCTWVQRQGRSPHDAEDLTQAFFARLLERRWLESADPGKGRFRTFLLVALKRFLADDWDRSRALKRGGGAIPVPIDTRLADGDGLLSSGDSASPDAGYDWLWALALLERSLATLRCEYAGTGREAEFDLLKEYLTVGRGEIPYAGVAERLGVGASAARVSVHRLRKRFREAFRAEVAATVADPSEIEDELRQLRAALAS